jgi:hypothetical protein
VKGDRAVVVRKGKIVTIAADDLRIGDLAWYKQGISFLLI